MIEMAKRLFDIIVSLILIIILSPIFFVLALMVGIKVGKPVLFRQKRPGFLGRPFTLYKFRTMTEEKDKYGIILPDEERLTELGRKMRKYSLDELPQLINVLSGDLSFVGPRPLLMEYLDRYNANQARRHEVKPGITGWAQINGRNAISWEEKFELDVWYVDHRSFLLDLKILWLTIWKVFRAEGISGEGVLTMSKFWGSKSAKDD